MHLTPWLSHPLFPRLVLLLGAAGAAGLTHIVARHLTLRLAPSHTQALARQLGQPGPSPWLERLGHWLLARFPGLVQLGHLEEHRRWVALAGEPPSLAQLLGASLLLASLGLGLALVTRTPLALGLFPLGGLYPAARLRAQAQARKRQVERALPELTALLAAEMAAGNPPDRALERASQWGGPLAAILQEAVTQARLQGRPLFGRRPTPGLLLEVVTRYHLPSLHAFAAQVDLAAQKGAAGPELMQSLARTLVLAYREQALRAAESLESRLAVPSALFFFLPFLFLILVPLLLPILELL